MRRSTPPRARHQRWVDWTPDLKSAFRLAGDDWLPPKQIRITGGENSMTVVARFRRPDGPPVTLKTRLRRTSKSGWHVTEETLVFTSFIPSTRPLR